MINLIKVGKTTKDPQERAKELSTVTGVPTPFIVVYQCYFESCSAAETFVHTYLESKGYRVSKNREFFEIPSQIAVEAVIQASNHFGNFSADITTDVDDMEISTSEIDDDFLNDLEYIPEISNPWDESLFLAECYYYGHQEDYLQDYDEALKYFVQASKLGCVEAYKYLGKMYKNGEGVKENKQKALQYFKEGAYRKDIDCYAEMATLFELDQHIDNAIKCWRKYFELSQQLKPEYASYYIGFVNRHNIPLQFEGNLRSIKTEIIENLERLLEHCIQQNDIDVKAYCEETLDYVNSNL